MKNIHFLFITAVCLFVLSCEANQNEVETEIETPTPPAEELYDFQGKIIGYLKWTESYEPEKRFYYSGGEKYFIYPLVNEITAVRMEGTNEQGYKDLMQRVLGEYEIRRIPDGDRRYTLELKDVRHRKKRMHELLMDNQTETVGEIYSDYPTQRHYGLYWDNGICGQPNDFLDSEKKEDVLKPFHLKYKDTGFFGAEYYSSLKEADAITIGNQLYETGLWKWVRADFYVELFFFNERNPIPSSYNNIPPPDTVFGVLIRSLNDTLLTFSLPPEYLGMNLSRLNDGIFGISGDLITFNSREAKPEEVEYYEFFQPSGLPSKEIYRQVIITDIKKK